MNKKEISKIQFCQIQMICNFYVYRTKNRAFMNFDNVNMQRKYE